MDRRQYLQTLSAIGSIGMLSGCSALNSTETEQNNNPEELKKGTPTTEQQDPERIGRLLGNYKAGYEGLDAGIELLGTSIESLQDGSYQLVQRTLSDFERRMDDIANSFNDAATVADRMGKPTIVESARAGEKAAEYLGDSGKALAQAARAAANNNTEAQINLLEDAQDAAKKARRARKDVLPPSKIREKLE